MSDQSLNGLLQWMQGTSVTRGWDAVVTMNRPKVNQLLEQQYISQFNQNSFLKRIHGSVPLTSSGYEVLELTGLLLSQPRLSFETASLSDSRAHLTMDIVSGMVAYKVKAPGVSERITSSFAITEQHLFTLVMEVDLHAVIGSVGRKGEVVLDIAEGYDFSCNLVDQPLAQQALGEFFHALFKRQPASARRYVLGMLDFDPDDKLAPRNFQVRTQAAPGAKVAGSDSYGEGAVVLFVRTRENLLDGSTPGDDSDFRYLIPDDREAGSGKPRYSGSLILASRAVFDWFIQGYLERNIGRGLSLLRTSDSNDLARGLKARAGSWTVDDIELSHSGGGYSQSASNNVPLTFDFASSAAGSAPFEVSVGAGGLLRFAWKGVNTFSFHFTRKELLGGDVRKEDANVRFTHNLEFFLKASVDPLTSVVIFASAPGGSSSASVEKISGDIDLFNGFANVFEARLKGLIDSMHDQLKEIRLPELDLFAINHLLFPEQNALLLTHAALPGDLALFGHINPKHTALKLEPSIVHVLAGTTKQFAVLEQQLKGRAGKLTWSVRSIDGSRALGDINQSGMFTAPPRERMVGQAVRNVVTATLEDGGNTFSASALVVVVAEALVVTPGMATVDLQRPEPVTLKASTLDGGTIKWTLRSGGGSLQANGNQAVYTPPTSIGQPVAAAHIEAEDTSTGAKVVATVLLLQSIFALALAPAFHPGLPPGASTRVRLADEDLPSDAIRWSVSAGEGTVNAETGVFTAPARITLPYSVVQATAEDDFNDYYGYSIIYQSEYASEARWSELLKFELKAMSSLQLFANGQQQVEVEVEVQPRDVDEVLVDLSDAELNSIVLVNAHTLEPLPRVDSEGVPVDGDWAYNESHNDYLFHPGGRDRTNGVNARIKTLYVQTRAGSKTTIAAMLTRDDLMPFYSNEKGNGSDKTIEPIPVQPPKFDNASYKFEVTRVIGEEDNDYHLDTVDYYILQLTHNSENIHFRHIEFEERSGMVQWESRQFEEDVVSYTGYALRGDTELRFDTGLYDHIPDAVRPEPGVVPGEECPEGALLISLHRSQYWRFDLACEQTYARPVKLRILDDYGNQHRLQVNFRSPSNRNELRITVL
ncbi:hypothetical protein [Pseudomonas sp. Marseille-P9899]|uniref:hypothetical protein n=1 Tax=Pseudomonas sp. Marseille-P9899 TaxID=2730401 RepID=UPI00158895E7|nr:hypothetical protein [Pseudomonas sp. Marseille-P9899]